MLECEEGIAPGASDWATIRAPVDRFRPWERQSSTALMVALSISSSIEGRTRLRMATTARDAAVIVGKLLIRVAPAVWAGINRNASPATSLIRLPPRVTKVPSASTTSMPST